MSLLPDSTPNTKGVLWGIAGEAIKRGTANTTNGKKPNLPSSETLGAIAFVLLVLTIASSPMKILVRKNFGPKAISITEILFGTIFFVICAAWMSMFIEYEYDRYYQAAANAAQFGVDITHVETWRDTLFRNLPKILLFTAFIVFVKGIWQYLKAQRIESDDWTVENYRGDSLLFKKKAISPKMQCRVWRNIEPITCLIISFALFPILGFAAIPFIIASLMFKANEYYHVKYKWEKLLTPQPSPTPSPLQGDINGSGHFTAE